jgi:DNA-binding response OmpR family regulator
MGEVLEGGKGRILFIGGDPDVTRTLQVYLDAYQFSVQVVSRGDEALTACRQSPPDAVILTPNLPDMDGYDLCRQIRGDELTEDSLILVLLPTDDRRAKLAALEAGADEVMMRSVDMEEVRLRIESVLGR